MVLSSRTCPTLQRHARPRSSKLKRQLESRRQRHARGNRRHLLLRNVFGASNRVIERGRDQVFQHVLVVADQAGIDRNTPHIVLALIVTLTMPAPDWPSTSVAASSSCMRFMFSCIFCACCIKPAIWPFIMVSFPYRCRYARFRRSRATFADLSVRGRIDPGSTDAPKFSINSRTKGSAYIDSSA